MIFIRKLEEHTMKIKMNDLESLSLIKDLLNSQYHLYEGVELIIHIICIASVKISVESVVESLVSRYEIHFDKERQLKEEHALNENGPKFAKADKILKAAMNMYWKNKEFSGEWHFTHKSEDIRTFYSGKSKVMTKLMNETSKLSFMDH